MKKTVSSSAILLLLLILFVNAKCKKEQSAPQLPPETTIGAMTFGCKINGNVFVARDGNLKPGLYVQYVDLGSGSNGGWFLNIPAYDYKSKPIRNINISTDSLLVVEGMTYEFKNAKGYPMALCTIENSSGLSVYYKRENDDGFLRITKLDKNTRILSGIFAFTASDENGSKVEVTEGRFDVRY